MRFLVVLAGFLWAVSGFAYAHELTLAALTLSETRDGVFEVTWKQATTNGQKLALEPVLPEACAGEPTPQILRTDNVFVTRRIVRCQMDEGHIRISGLERTLTDVLVSIEYLDGHKRRALLRPGEAGLDLAEAEAGAAPIYVVLGVEHILSGPDHLLFVAGLLLLARLRQLFMVITAFTLAHSLTLAMTTFGLASLPSTPVETLIALSILLLAAEAAQIKEGRQSLTARRPWLISFGFGLLHGFGFAGALSEIGLPKGEEIAALFFFNTGVELGQLLFVGCLLLVAFVLSKLSGKALTYARQAAVYSIGTAGAFWVIERMSTLFSV